MPRSIDLVISEAEDVQIGDVPAKRVTYSFQNAVGIDTELFVVVSAPTADNPDRIEYKCVAAASDLDNLSAGSPPDDTPGQLFRIDQIQVISSDIGYLSELTDSIKRRVQSLLDTLKKLDALEVSTTVSFSDA